MYMKVKEYVSELNRQEILYTIGTMLLIGTKALGMEESTIIFRVIMLIGFAFIGLKILLDKNSIKEWLMIVLAMGFGIFQFFNMGSLGLAILMALFSGMKNINIKKLFKALAFEYVICFIITIVLALFKVIDPNYVTTIKYGTEITRNSLGYAHPNVLHITYVIVMCLVLYVSDFYGKKLFILISSLLIGDVLIFLFSASETGFAMSIVLIVIYLFQKIYHKDRNKDYSKVERIIIYVFLALVLVGYIIFALTIDYLSEINAICLSLYESINSILNQRVLAIAIINDYTGISIWGRMLNTYGGWALDCSYAYALYSYGILFYSTLVFAYFAMMKYLVDNKRWLDISILITFMVAGVTEPFLFNVSVKNLTIFMLGEWAFSIVGKYDKKV